MYSLKALALVFLALDAISVAHATLYITIPSQGFTCHGGQPCTVQWLDDGVSPLLSEIGVTIVGLFTSDQQLVQTIQPVDVSTEQSLTFTPIPEAGPDSSDYYIAFTSVSLQVNGTSFIGFSPFFNLDQMSGSFSSPLASATSSIPIPSSLTAPAGSSDTSSLPTIIVGSLSTSLPPISTLSAITPSSTPSSTSTSTFSTSVSASGSTTASPASTTLPFSNGASQRIGSIPLPVLGILSLSSLFLLL